VPKVWYTVNYTTVDKEGDLVKDYIGAKLSQAQVFAGVMAEQEAVAITLGTSKTRCLYVLPARARSGRDESTWADEIDLLYGPDAKHEASRHITVRALRGQGALANIVMQSVDEHWRPLQFGVIVSSDDDETAHWAYIVPALPYWKVRVEGE
jgi:hypothetical protein